MNRKNIKFSNGRWPSTRRKPNRKKRLIESTASPRLRPKRMQPLGVAGFAVLLVAAAAAGEAKGVGSAPKHTEQQLPKRQPTSTLAPADQGHQWTGWVKLPLPYPAVKQYAQDVPSSVYPWRPSAIDQVCARVPNGVSSCVHTAQSPAAAVGVAWTFLTAYGALCCAAGSVPDQAQAAADQAVPGPDPRLRCVGPSGRRSSAVQSSLLLQRR